MGIISSDKNLNAGLAKCKLLMPKHGNLLKMHKLRDITNYIRPAILGITESKLDSSVTNAEVNKY